MKKLLATLKVYADPESPESSISARHGLRDFEVTINRGIEPYVLRTKSEVQTALAHELGHFVALLTNDPTHNALYKVHQLETGSTELVIPGEQKAWELAGIIWPNYNREQASSAMASYFDNEENNNYGVR